ncbi:MAG: FecR domain-containing protein [Pseudomonadota bacterium]
MMVIDTVSHNDGHLWRARLDEGLTPDERREFEAWLEARPEHRLALAQAEVTWGALGQADFSGWENAASDAHNAEDASASAFANDNAPASSWTRWMVSMAACLVAVVGAWWVWSQPFTPPEQTERQLFASAEGVSTMIKLPDRSRIRLAPSSRLDFAFLEDRRDVRLLEGSARFTVAKRSDQPFLVRTKIAQVRVTGTQFDAALVEDQLEVRVREGSVDVLPSAAGLTDSAPISLVSGEAIATKDGVASVRLIQTGVIETRMAQASKAGTGRLEYIGAPLSQVVDDINRLGGGPIAVDPAVASLRLSGTFELSEVGAISGVIDAALPVAIKERDGVRVIVPE